jgi:hypothetical protein
MPVESEQAQAGASARDARELVPRAPGPVTAQPPETEPPALGPRPPHEEHELPDGRYLIAYRSAPNA